MTAPGTFLAFDAGGTRLKAGVVSRETGEVLRMTTVPTGPQCDRSLLQIRIVEAASSLAPKGGFQGIGLCVPGLVNQAGVVVELPHKLPGLVGFDLPGFLQETFGQPSVVVNDALAYAVGEAHYGAGAGFGRCLVITVGTGIGVGVVEGGRPMGTGIVGGGILGGHAPVDPVIPAEDDCWDPSVGTIEAHCRAQRILECANEAGGTFQSIPELYAAHAAGISEARAGIEQYQRELARGILMLTFAHGPDRIILGGGPMTAESPILHGLESLIHRRLWKVYRPSVTVAKLGDGSALAGLARLHAEKHAH